MRIIKTFAAVIALLVLNGCAGTGKETFACGEPGSNEKKCASTMEAYNNSHGPMGLGAKPTKPSDLVVSVPALGAAIDDSRWPRPVLEPAQVLRIWIAPWVDGKESLHWPSYVFTEVQTRRWTYGEPDFRGAKMLVPLQVEHRTSSDSQGNTSTKGSK